MSISVIIASIPPRTELLERCLKSVLSQTLQPNKILINIDKDRLGAAESRDNLIKSCNTDYVAILDDDDQFLPNHLEVLYNHIVNEQADLAYPSWVNEYGYETHLDFIFGKFWDNNQIHQVPITWMAKTSSLLDVGGFSSNFDIFNAEVDQHGHRIGEDFGVIQKFAKSNKKITHINEVTWIWNTGGGPNTQGRPDRW